MSPIIINSTVNNNLTKPKMIKRDVPDAEPAPEENTEKATDERRATGRTIAIIIFVVLMCTAIYHVIQKKTSVLTGILVPAIILFTYLFFVIHVSTREKKKRQLEASNDMELSVQSDTNKLEIHKKISTVSSPSLSSMDHQSKYSMSPSTSGVSMGSRNNLKQVIPKVSSCSRMDLKNPKCSIDPKAASVTQKPAPFKKAQSQSHIQVKSNQSLAHVNIEHERKKLKKSRSFEKNNCLVDPRHTSMIDSKKPKTKH